MSNVMTKREAEEAGTGGDGISRRADAVPSEIVENGSGSPDMSDTSVSSAASNGDDRRLQQHANDEDDDDDYDYEDDHGVNNGTSSNGLKTPSPPPDVLTQLARQLEYYFSSRNLAKDTYVQTLRSLNDGCVPVAILANFAKVKALLQLPLLLPSGTSGDDEEGRFHAILQAAAEHSDLLRVCSIETSTGKIATDDTPSSAATILAVGPVGNAPLLMGGGGDQGADDAAMMRTPHGLAAPLDGSSFALASTTQEQQQLLHRHEASPAAAASGNTNTIILREVHPEVTEAEIRELFCFEGCPEIEAVRPDVAHCWFIALDTTSRDDMLRVMMTIRTQTLHGEYVQARLKATARAPVETASPMPTLWPEDVLLAMQASAAAAAAAALDGGKKKRRKRKKKKKHGKKAGAAASDPSLLPAAGGSSVPQSGKNQGAPPPSMGEDDFPTIQVKKVEFVTMPKDEKPDEEKERTKSLSSDAASTATTNSSSLDSFVTPKPFTGYAAALLKAPSPVTITEPPGPSPTGSVKNLKRLPSVPGAAPDAIADVSDGPRPTPGAGGAGPPVTVLPPLWGRSRSFADILREDNRGRATTAS